MGPLELADFIGLDVCVNILEVLYDGFRRLKISRLSAAAEDGRGRLAGAEKRAGILSAIP